MTKPGQTRALCWKPLWNPQRIGLGLEHLLLSPRSARSALTAFHEDGEPFTLTYRMDWDDRWQLHWADLVVERAAGRRTLTLRTDGQGNWRDGQGAALPELAGCRDIDIWPTPFTNSFPLLRSRLAISERREFHMAWVSAPDLTVKSQPQAYTRLSERRYRFENLDGSGFTTEITVDEDGLVVDYPGFFQRVPAAD